MSHLSIELDLPTVAHVPDSVHTDARNAVIVHLYKKDVLSMLQAADLIGCGRREFEELLPDYGYTMMDERDITTELAYINQYS